MTANITPDPISEAPLWTPTPERIASARIKLFQNFCEVRLCKTFSNFDEFWRWTTTDLNGFWQAVWDFHAMASATPYDKPLSLHQMPGAEWFNGATLNFVDQVFRHRSDPIISAKPAIVYYAEDLQRTEVSWQELYERVASLAAHLRDLGVVKGDRVVAFLPNTPDCIVAFLAVASIGAIWSVCSPDMGPVSVLDRFKQIEPKVLIACSNYVYGGKTFDRSDVVAELRAALPTVKAVVQVDKLAHLPAARHLQIDAVAFAHPLWIVYSSGTTGLPKPIVHGHGGIILESYVSHIANDIGPQDKYLQLSSTGWIVWNLHMAALTIGATVVIFNGNPGYPDLTTAWRLIMMLQ